MQSLQASSRRQEAHNQLMRARLSYLLVLLVSIAAVAIGAWPSLLTLGAVLAIGTGGAASIGAAKPSIVDSRPALRRFTLGGGVLLALELLTLASYIAATPRRMVHIVVPSDVPALVRIVYGVRDRTSSPLWRWDRYFNADSGAPRLIHTHLAPDNGWFRPDDPHPVVARTRYLFDSLAAWLQALDGSMHRGRVC
jgi:hypothetical protein